MVHGRNVMAIFLGIVPSSDTQNEYRKSGTESTERPLWTSAGGPSQPQVLQVTLAVIFSNRCNEGVPVTTHQSSLDIPKLTKEQRKLRNILIFVSTVLLKVLVVQFSC